MTALKLLALDEDDLKVMSAHVQDAVMKVGDLQFLPAAKRFVLPMNRFAWEVKTGIRRDEPDDVLSLLAVSFVPINAPAGLVELIFSGGGTVVLDVECIEARLADVGGAWQAAARPVHKV